MPGLTLSKRRLQGFFAQGEKYANLDLSSMLAYGSKWLECEFVNCDLSMADLRASLFDSCRFHNCYMPMTNFTGGSALRHTVFVDTELKNAAFIGVSPFDDVQFLGCKLQYASFHDATAREIVFDGCNLHGADLRFIECNKATYDNCVLWNSSIQLGCQAFGHGKTYDERSLHLFVAMVTRLFPMESNHRRLLEEVAGDQLDVVERMMREPEKVLA